MQFLNPSIFRRAGLQKKHHLGFLKEWHGMALYTAAVELSIEACVAVVVLEKAL